MSRDAIGGKYVPVRPLASGGMAEVELARQVGIDGFEKLVVLKRIRPEYANDREFVTRFLDEARTVADLRHPNLVQVYDAGRDGSGFYLAMAFVHGVSVRQLWKQAEERKERVPVGHALQIVIGAARGLHYAHEKADMGGRPLGIVHRDVSPQNLLVSFQGEVKVADFGIARADNQQHLTRPGHVWGKLDYMAPEQARGGVVSAASDQFALGIIAWELVTGERLFRRETDAETLRAVLTASVPSIATRVPGFPPAIERAILRALSPEMTLRHLSCASFAAELEEAALRAPVALSEGRLAEYLSALFPSEAKHLSIPPTLPNPVAVVSPSPEPGVASSRKSSRRYAFGAVAGIAIAVAAGWVWTRSTRRLLDQAEVDLAAGRSRAALAAAITFLEKDLSDPQARMLAVAAVQDISGAKAEIDPKAALEWLRKTVAENPVLEDAVRTQMLVLEIRSFIANDMRQDETSKVDQFVFKNVDRPEVALAAAYALRKYGTRADVYMWMYERALDGGLAADPRMLEDAFEVLKGDVYPHSPVQWSALRVAKAIDDTALRAWARSAVFSATGYEMLSAASVAEGLDENYLSSVINLMTSDGLGEGEVDRFVERIREIPAREQRRVIDVLRLAVKDERTQALNRERVAAALAELEKAPPASR